MKKKRIEKIKVFVSPNKIPKIECRKTIVNFFDLLFSMKNYCGTTWKPLYSSCEGSYCFLHTWWEESFPFFLSVLGTFCWFYCCSCCFWSCVARLVECWYLFIYFFGHKRDRERATLENVSLVFFLPLLPSCLWSVYACEETCSLWWTPYSVCLNWTPSTER